MLASSVLKDTIVNSNNICDSSLLEPETVFIFLQKVTSRQKTQKKWHDINSIIA